MRRDDQPDPVWQSLPRPGPGLRAALLTLFAIWLTFAVAINWGGASPEVFADLCGNNALILRGQVWRLLTGPLLHHPSSLGGILFMLLGLYFLSPSLESRWGSRRFLWFLVGSGLGAYVFQLLVWMLLPGSIAGKLVPEYWFGALPMIEAIAIAWAMSFAGQTVRLMMLVPVSSRTLVWFVVGTSVLAVVALSEQPSGLISPFGGMLAGWLLGGGQVSPVRRWWLRQKLAATEHALERERRRRSERVAASGLRVLGRPDGTDDDSPETTEPPDSGPRSSDGRSDDGRGPDGRLLN